jgi:hypothetical protein
VAIAGMMAQRRWTILFAFDAKRRPGSCANWAKGVIVGNACETRPNENKLSRGYRERGWQTSELL